MIGYRASVSPERSRDVLLVLLAATTGAVDATAIERLGHVFASVITGNLVLLGVSAVRNTQDVALSSGCALAGYAVGVLLAAPRRSRGPRTPRRPPDDNVWPSGTTAALTIDLGLMVVFAAGWELAGGRPGRGAQTALLSIAAGAMGVQSSAVRRLGQMSTTYLTSTLTGLLETAITRSWSAGDGRSAGIVAMAVAGAAGATEILLHALAWLPVLPLLPLVTVVLLSRRLVQSESTTS
ncbi:MAG: YoaK family protein [Solirubrobacteraceae bacterium]